MNQRLGGMPGSIHAHKTSALATAVQVLDINSQKVWMQHQREDPLLMSIIDFLTFGHLPRQGLENISLILDLVHRCCRNE